MILITGGSGVIGRHLSYTGTYLGRRPLSGRVCMEADLTGDIPSLAGFDTVIHLAQSRKYKDGPEHWDDVWGVNADATFRLLDASRKAGVKHFIYASTGSVETGHDMYAASKQAGEAAVEAFSGAMDTLILRFYAVYGEGQREDALVPTLVRRVIEGKDIQNGIKTAPCYAGDAAAAIERAVAMKDRGLRIVAGPDVLTAHDMADIIGGEYRLAPVLSGGTPQVLCRHSDYPTNITFADGLRRMRQHEAPVPGRKRLRGKRQRLPAGAGERRGGDEVLHRAQS